MRKSSIASSLRRVRPAPVAVALRFRLGLSESAHRRPASASLCAFLVLAFLGCFLDSALGESKPTPPRQPEVLQLSNGRTAIFLAQKKSTPLLIFLHSGGGSASVSLASSGFATAARRAGVSLVFGDSRDGVWRYNGLDGADDASDEEYILELRAALVARGYGSKGVFIAGFSNGAMIGWQTACRHPTLFQGVAMISSAMPAAVGEDCAALPSRVVAVIGSEDRVMPIEGGVGAVPQIGPLWSPTRLADELSHHRQCARFAIVPIRERSRGGRAVVLFRAAKCKLPGRTDLYLVQGGGHDGYGEEGWKEPPRGQRREFLAPELIVSAFAEARSKN